MTKQQLREAIRSIIRQELKEAMPASAKRAFEKDIMTDPDYIELKKKIQSRFYDKFNSGDFTGEVPNVAKRDYYVKNDRFTDIDKFEDEDEELAENKPATTPSKPKTEPTVAPGKPAEKKPRRPLGNPEVKPKPKATMTEAEILTRIIKRFKSKK